MAVLVWLGLLPSWTCPVLLALLEVRQDRQRVVVDLGDIGEDGGGLLVPVVVNDRNTSPILVI